MNNKPLVVEEDFLQSSVIMEVPITVSKKVQVAGSSVSLINTGDEDVTIDGKITVQAGQSITFSQNSDTNIIWFSHYISFSGTGVNPRLEIISIVPDEIGYGNYIPK